MGLSVEQAAELKAHVAMKDFISSVKFVKTRDERAKILSAYLRALIKLSDAEELSTVGNGPFESEAVIAPKLMEVLRNDIKGAQFASEKQLNWIRRILYSHIAFLVESAPETWKAKFY